MSTRLVCGAAAAVGIGAAVGAGRVRLAGALTVLAVAALAAGLATSRRGTAAAVMVVAAVAAAASADASWRARADASRLLPRLVARVTTASACGVVTGQGPRSFAVSARNVTVGRSRWTVREPVLVVPGRTRHPRVLPGHRICATGALRRGREPRAPPVLLADSLEVRGVASPLRLAASVVRLRFSAAAQRALPPRQAGLLLGMTDGDTRLLDDDTIEAFRTTGLAHLVAVSGENVSVFLALVLALSRVLVRRRRALRLALVGPPLVFFAFLTGLEPSVLRAVITAGIVLVVTAAGRPADGLRAAALSFIVLVLASPDLVADAGFQLSFGATVGLVLGAGPLSDRIARRIGGSQPAGLARFMATAAGTTVAAQVAVAPILAAHFGRIPALGGVANLLAVPMAPFVTVGGLVSLGLASLWTGVAWAPATLRVCLDAILAIARTFALLPAASVQAGPLAGAALTSGVVAVLTTARTRSCAAALAVSLACGASGQAAASAGRSCSGGADVRALDVGQGTAVLLRAEGRAVLVDGGPAQGHVERLLASLRVHRLDLMVISHPHADHIQGLVLSMGRVRVGGLVGPATMGWPPLGPQLLRAARAHRIPVRTAAAGDTLRLGPHFVLDVVWPEPGPPPSDRSNDAVNATELVLRARVGGMTVLLPGDENSSGEDSLLENRRPVDAPLLIAPHHGSADLDPAFVDAVAPRLTIVTVGAHNRYGQPTPTAMRIYRRHGAVLRTDRDGTVAVCVRGETAKVTRHA